MAHVGQTGVCQALRRRPDLVPRVTAAVSPADLHHVALGVLYAALLDVVGTKGANYDAAADLVPALHRHGLAEVGGPPALQRAMVTLATPAPVACLDDHLAEVQQASALRRCIHATAEII